MEAKRFITLDRLERFARLQPRGDVGDGRRTERRADGDARELDDFVVRM